MRLAAIAPLLWGDYQMEERSSPLRLPHRRKKVQELKSVEKWIAVRIREHRPREPRVEAMAENIDAIFRKYDMPREKLLAVFDLIPKDEPLRLDPIVAWAERYAEARDRI
jgi:hypothetical protein